MAVIAELDASLQVLLSLKPPGVTKTRIASITTLCIDNIKSESVLIQRIYTHYKRTPGSHKLGVVYVIDSVTRQWLEKAAASGQDTSGGTAPDGTFAAGVHRVTQLLPLFMNDLISTAPDDQKEKVAKLVDIWLRGDVFPAEMLHSFQRKMNVHSKPLVSQVSEVRTPTSTTGMPSPISFDSTQPVPTINVPVKPTPMNNGSATTQNHENSPAQDNLGVLASILPPGSISDPTRLAYWLRILQQLLELKVPQEEWPGVIDALQEQDPEPKPIIPASASPMSQSRPRSRSPPRRPSPTYDNYDGGKYRQRDSIKNEAVLQQDKIMLIDEPKFVDFEMELPEGHIKVLSRTLFVGGASCEDAELRRLCSRYGEVQTCINYPNKRHAFVKMTKRAAALAVKESMANKNDPDLASKIRSVSWGIGYGPRDCCNYQDGVSIIPLDRLAEVDQKAALISKNGGTDGKPLTPGIVMEEPDIEMGGLSSKAASRKKPDVRHSGTPASGRGSGSPSVYPRRGRTSHTAQDEIPPAVPTFGFEFQIAAKPPPGMPPMA